MAAAVEAQHDGGEGGDRPRKRARLESVVPSLPGGARGRQGRVRPPLWVSGMAPRGTRGSGRGRVVRGGGGARGGRGRGTWQQHAGFIHRGRGGGWGRAGRATRGFYY